MPNVLAGREVFPEFIQREANEVNLAREANRFLDDPGRRLELREELMYRDFRWPGAAGRAAESIGRLLKN